MNRAWLESYRPLSINLMKYGWFLPSYLHNSDYEIIQKVCKKLDKDPIDTEARRSIENEIYYSLIDVVFHPNWRSRGVWYGIRLPHFKEFSHIYESAIFSYYKREYSACIILLLCALEGILRSFAGIENPKFHELVKSIRNAPSRNIVEAHEMYKATLADFLSTWIYKKTDAQDADFSLSVLNRHYVMHGLHPGEFYRPQDAHRMILAFDLLIDFLGIDSGIYDSVFLPDEGQDVFFDKRRNYFTSLGEGDHTVKQTWKIEQELLKDHPRYVAPILDLPDMEKSRLMGMLDHMALLQIAAKQR